ncbi:MAG: bifunctional (p)ppGpp synthetase/guanosine-3',5'-bis(diphosphate) 3'-pyrophosphohydrolase [Deltaproteobacteria bacterium]|nr:MAG: bifunctional (p)ppGpp synthetase/guanosine-3',5'-bis(diphosphate) 3'-pyrophosphohydrolase [Deltaproteobacteria bacterium]
MIRLNDITASLLSYHPKADLSLVEKAYVYSAKVHQGQVRLSGEPYLSHPLEVAHILTRMKMDVISVVSGLLHDTLEDTDAKLSEIERLFGKEAANIVDGVTKISKMQFTSHEERQAENMRKMILAMATDIRVIMVKLADRLHNMQTLGFQVPEKQKLIARETLDIYSPLAGRMGIYWLKSMLEDLCLYYLEPQIYETIKSETAERRGARERYIREVKELLGEKFKESGIEATIKGRQKHFYSIYNKMRDQNLTVNQVYDILALRVIVNSVKECYEVLGLIHAMWKPVPGRFKDYVSLPKANMYQSLHTTLVGPLGQRMEVQIRTWQMDKIAEEGIAAHWKYKEGRVASKTDENQFAWLRRLLEWQKNLQDPKEFLDTVRMDLFPNEVYVFTPKGEVKEFPKGATPVDFAYSIHSEVGEKCIGARVNGKMVPLRYQLRNGDIVEIITSTKQHPREDWLDYVKTSRAKTKIRQWIRNQERDESINLGRQILEKGLEQSHLSLTNILKSEQISRVSEDLSFHSVEDLLANIGYGKISANQVIGRLKPKLGIEEEKPTGLVGKVVSRIKRKKSTRGIKVKGVDDILVRFANCCHPLPGEHVVGFITRGRGVTIHKHNCRHILDADRERLVEVTWEPSEQDVYLARLKVTAVDKKGILANISSIMAQKDANIIQAEVKTTMDKKGISLFTIEVENFEQLQDIMGAIKRVRNVLFVERL